MKYLITGANRGLGLEFVQQLLAKGAEIIATARNPEGAPELMKLVEGSGGKLRVLALDITDAAQCEALTASLESEAVDVLINNAGILLSGGSLGSIDYKQMQLCFEINTLGPLRIIEAALPALRRGKGKKIINLTSKMGSIGDNTSGGAVAYRTSKTALNMAIKSIAFELVSEDFVTFLIHPGWVITAMGGPNGLINTEQSVSSMLSVIDKADASYNGTFQEWNGNLIPW